MNKERRKLIDEAIALIEEGRGKLEDAKTQLEQARDEEQDYYDNMPESFQDGDKGSMAQEAIDALESAILDLENTALSALDEVISNAQNAQG